MMNAIDQGLGTQLNRPGLAVGRLVWGVSAVVMVAMLTGCHKLKSEDTEQVAAEVNGSDISVHQVKTYLSANPALNGLGDAAASRALDVMVEQELAAQAAKQEGLDKSPTVIQAMEIAKREVLARAYQDVLAAKANLPDSEAIRRYYDDHPELFANRKHYTLSQTLLKFEGPVPEGLKDKIERASDAETVHKLFEQQGLSAHPLTVAQWAENLPMDVVSKLAFLKDGQSVVLEQPGVWQVLTIIKTESKPVARNVAQEAIRNALHGQARRAQVQEGMDDLRKQAKIERKGAFAAAVASEAASAPR